MAVKPKLLVVGSSNVDFVSKIPRIPNAGETVISNSRYSFVPGGKGANSAVAAARLGGDVMFCARLGADTYGAELKRIYGEEKIDTRYVTLDKNAQTGFASVMVEGNGQNRIIVFPGANNALCTDDVEDAFLSYPDAVLTQFEVNNDALTATIKKANAASVPVFIDAGPAKQDFSVVGLEGIEIFSPNESETYAYTGIRPGTADDCLYACMKLYNAMDVKYIVLKLGERGAFIYDGKYCEIAEAYNVTALDTTAAGDAFTAAMTLNYLENGGNITKAVRYANAVGALTVMSEGALHSLPFASQVEEFIEKAKNS